MRDFDFPNEATVPNSAANAAHLAERIRDAEAVYVYGRRLAHEKRCSLCGRRPKSGHLLRIVIHEEVFKTAMIGLGFCRRHLLADALRRLIREENTGDHPNRMRREARLQDVLSRIG